MKSKRRAKIKGTKKLVGGIFIAIILIIVIMSWMQSETGMSPSGAVPAPMQGGNMAQPQVEKTATLRLEQQGTDTVNVIVDAGKSPISAAQLQISYDPRILTNVSIQKGDFFSEPIELQNKIDSINGVINYAIGIIPTNQSQPGSGIVAIIHYATNPGLTTKTHMNFLPGTKVTVEGVNDSVLQEPLGIDLNVSP